MTETTDITVQLTSYLHRLAESTRVDSDLEGVVSDQRRPALPDDLPRRTTSRFVTRAAVIVLLVGGVGLLVATTRSDSEPPATSDVAEPTSSAPRLLAPEDLPTAFEPVVAEVDARVSFESDPIERIYSAVDARYEEGPTLSVVAYDAERAEPQVEADAIDVEIQGTSGSIWSPGPSQERIRFGPIDATWYLLTGYGLDRTALLALAETVTAAPDGFGAVADSSQFSTAMTEIAAGVRHGGAGMHAGQVPDGGGLSHEAVHFLVGAEAGENALCLAAESAGGAGDRHRTAAA